VPLLCLLSQRDERAERREDHSQSIQVLLPQNYIERPQLSTNNTADDGKPICERGEKSRLEEEDGRTDATMEGKSVCNEERLFFEWKKNERDRDLVLT
jgi:hypothetical protein